MKLQAYPECRNNDADHFLFDSTLSNIDKDGYNVKVPKVGKSKDESNGLA